MTSDSRDLNAPTRTSAISHPEAGKPPQVSLVTNLAQSLDHKSEQDTDTERFNEGEVTTDDIEAQDLTGSRTSPTPDTALHVISPVPDISGTVLTRLTNRLFYTDALEQEVAQQGNYLTTKDHPQSGRHLVTEMPLSKEYAAVVEAKHITQQKVQDTPRGQQTFPGKPSTRSRNSHTASPITRPAPGQTITHHESSQKGNIKRISDLVWSPTLSQPRPPLGPPPAARKGIIEASPNIKNQAKNLPMSPDTCHHSDTT